ncbi:MAG: S-layer homology domain-containing protein [Tissierellia bacterium]|nr:S-layer homology domain-containing protein [Tissierellia bacterium]MDD3226151.1 S-layer homology domain-containing protein [Tissierellia bacterium]MDD3751540.1 S-layer homology domain-containing protein [Tissierellia bacterium]MDD4045524.1 S-layer homology domain-containing protein [Tissierellia bacterium]MDD4677855.1 S-layer homology domain-containing protein [Tissierellia bacterium]
MKKLNRVILLSIVLSLLFTMTANAAVFSDISDHWARSYIESVEKNGLVDGYENGTFKPDNNVTVLESLIMMSRLYEIDEDIKEEIINEYKPSLKKMENLLGYDWSLDYLAVAIELGIIPEKTVKDWFANEAIIADATREQVAVLLINAMGFSEDAKTLKTYSLPFNDRADITASARPYIYLMHEKEIMLGDNENNINPKSKITRAEIATLLDKAFDYIDDKNIVPNFDKYEPTTTVSGMITEVEISRTESYIYVKNEREVESIVRINDDTKITVNGRTKELSDLKEDMLVICKINEERLAIDIEADSTKDVVRGTISYVAYVAPATITIYDEDDDKLTFDIAKDVDVYHDGKETELKSLDKNDEVMLLLDDDEAVKIYSISRIKHYEGVITSIDYNYPIKVTMKTDEDVSKTFIFTSDVDVTRNDDESSFDQIRVGDEVTITTKYDDMIAINTIAKEAEMSGVIREILIAPQSKIKIADEDGAIKQYSVSNNVKITIGSKNVSIYDLRLGYNVSVNTSGDEIVTMEVSEMETAKSFTGKIIFINEDDRLIMMQSVTSTGKTEIIYLSITNNTKIYDTSGSTKYFKDLEEGENILSIAVQQSGEYMAVSIMIQ